MTPDLDSFLEGEPGPAEAEPPAAPAAAGETAAVVAETTPAKSAPVARTERPSGDAEPAAKEDDDRPVPEDVSGLTKALVAERAKRNDHKGRADRLEGEMAALRAEVEAARKSATPPPAAEPPPEPMAVPSPLEDPAGYHAYQQRMLFNERLNMSEVMVRAQHDDVDAKLAVFKAAAANNPALRVELTRQVHPYQWVYQQAQRIMAMDEIGTDPAAFRAKVEADIRAKVEAEYAAGVPAAAAPRVTLPQSLGTARSAGPRSTPALNVPETFDDILAVGRK
jgi:hypothetical protein